MNSYRTIGLLMAAWLSATAAVADAGGASASFTAEEMELINRDARLVDAAKTCPRQLRRALDVRKGRGGGANPGHAQTEPVPCTPAAQDAGRSSAEGALDLLKLLKEAAGQSTNR